MRSVTYTMGVSLDGYIVGPDGGLDWSAPDEEVFRSALDEVRQLSAWLLGRRLYETMLYWETADDDPSLDDAEREFAAICNSLPKVLFSTTLSAVQGNARPATGSLAQEVERLRTQQGAGDIAVGGATLAAEAASLTSSTNSVPGFTPCWLAVTLPTFPPSNAEWISSSLGRASSPRLSSNSATASRGSWGGGGASAHDSAAAASPRRLVATAGTSRWRLGADLGPPDRFIPRRGCMPKGLLASTSVTKARFDVYGRYQLLIERHDNRWLVYVLGEGKRREHPTIFIPPETTQAELTAYLEDLLHEEGGPGRTIRRIGSDLP